MRKYAFENARDIIAVGFKLEKTFIFSDLDYVGLVLCSECRSSSVTSAERSAYTRPTQRCILSERRADRRQDHGQPVQGHFRLYRLVRTGSLNRKAYLPLTKPTICSDSVGKIHFVAVQAAPSFSDSFPQIFGDNGKVGCLIPCAIDQVRESRHLHPRLESFLDNHHSLHPRIRTSDLLETWRVGSNTRDRLSSTRNSSPPYKVLNRRCRPRTNFPPSSCRTTRRRSRPKSTNMPFLEGGRASRSIGNTVGIRMSTFLIST